MIRVIVREKDIGAAANVGGPVDIDYRTFDIDVPELEKLLRDKEQWKTREVVGVELIGPADTTVRKA